MVPECASLADPEVTAVAADTPRVRRPSAKPGRRRSNPPGKPLWIKLHRWVSLVAGFVLLVEVLSGAVLTMKPELDRLGAGERWTVTAGEKPLGAVEARAVVRKEMPELKAESVSLFRGVWLVTSGTDVKPVQRVYVDPGSGKINAVAGDEAWILRALVQLHDCAFSCEGYPLYASAMTRTPWGAVTVSQLVLGGMGLVLLFLCVSGIYIWWPTIRKFGSGFTVRRGRGNYALNLDLHKVVGIFAIPFLLMWAVSGVNFEFRWPEKVYYAVLPGENPKEIEGKPAGTGKLISFAKAEAEARQIYPTQRLTGIYGDPKIEEGYYGFTFAKGLDIYKYSYGEGTDYVEIDSHGGGVRGLYPKSGGPVTQKYWETWQVGLHFGSIVPWVPRLAVFTLFGLTPLLLAFTGTAVWWTKRRSRLERAKRAKREAAIAQAKADALR